MEMAGRVWCSFRFVALRFDRVLACLCLWVRLRVTCLFGARRRNLQRLLVDFETLQFLKGRSGCDQTRCRFKAYNRRPFLFGQLAQSSPNQITQCPSHLDDEDCQKPNGRATTRLSTAVGFRCGRAAASHDPTIYAKGHSWDQTGRRLIRYVGISQHP
jgi:hypothetical protein